MLLSFSRWGKRLVPRGANWVFLHGMGGTGALWRPISANLESDFEILAPDQRGHGGSRDVPGVDNRTPATYTPLDYGRDVVETLEHLSFYPAILVGHSMGVRTACAAAYLHPEGVRGLVLVDLGFSGVAGGGLGENLATFLRILPMEFQTREAARTFMDTRCPDPAIAQYLMAVSTRTQEGHLTFPFDRSALIQTIEAARDASVRKWVEALAARGVPIWVLRGAQSLVWSRAEFESERVHFAQFPNVRFLEVEGAGHGLPFEKRQQFTQILREFAAGG